MEEMTFLQFSSPLAIAQAREGCGVEIYISEIVPRMKLILSTISLMRLGASEVVLVIPKGVAKQICMDYEDLAQVQDYFNYFYKSCEGVDFDVLGDEEEGKEDIFYVWSFEKKEEA